MTQNPAPRQSDSKLLRAALAAILWVLVASQAAAAVDPACIRGEDRYADCGNGTVTDRVTGLVWLQKADCIGKLDLKTATRTVAALADGSCGLTDGSRPGDWRVPTKKDWEATVKGVEYRCLPSLTNDPGTRCLSEGPSAFSGVQADYYWSSTYGADNPTIAWFVYLALGDLKDAGWAGSRLVWPIRVGPGVTVFVDYDFGGDRENFTGHDADLRDNRIRQDRISSIMVSPGCRAVLFQNIEFGGRSTVVTDDISNMRDTEVGNDRVSSIQVECDDQEPSPATN